MILIKLISIVYYYYNIIIILIIIIIIISIVNIFKLLLLLFLLLLISSFSFHIVLVTHFHLLQFDTNPQGTIKVMLSDDFADVSFDITKQSYCRSNYSCLYLDPWDLNWPIGE